MAKVTKYEAFLNEKLRPDLKACLEDRDNIYAEIAEYASLKKSIEALKSAHTVEIKKREELHLKYKETLDTIEKEFKLKEEELSVGFLVLVLLPCQPVPISSLCSWPSSGSCSCSWTSAHGTHH